ncbi:MAG TPA: hypothetical protein VFL54_03080 [Gammaproteobacteria bacterium]|nr:hypothetical protein [Gammaproteobacteria bacterium]
MSAVVTGTGGEMAALGAGHSVLGERAVRIPTGGKIRAGIKVLTSAAARNKKAGDIYAVGVDRGESYANIEKRLRAECGFERSPLTPRNVPYFTVRRSDFAMPEVADTIMELYGEEREQGFHLYRFPVVFPVDSWQAVMPHGLKTYTRNQLLYWSEYGPDGARYCKTRQQPQQDTRNRRAHRAFGGRPEVLRPENGGICDPDNCPQYQSRQCNLSGSLLFFIPNVPGSSAIELPTTSFYSMQQARQKMEMVAFIRGGKISGTVNGQPIFYLTKAQREVSMLDPKTGEPKKVKQWLIELEADVDMTALFRAGEQWARLESGQSAAALLEGPAGETDGDYSEFDDADEAAGEPEEPEATDPPPAEPLPPSDADKESTKAARRAVMERIEALGITPDAITAYGEREHGEGWSANLAALNKLAETLDRAADDADLLATIKAANEVPF